MCIRDSSSPPSSSSRRHESGYRFQQLRAQGQCPTPPEIKIKDGEISHDLYQECGCLSLISQCPVLA
eukprot:1401158-Rhodomonas_salina.1